MRRHLPVLIVATALAAGLLGVPSAAADPAAVHLVYLDTSDGRVTTTSTDAPASRAALSPAGVTALHPTASPDGRVVAYGVRTGAADDASTTWGLYVGRAGQTRIVTDTWDTTPAIDSAGAVWWLSRADLWREDSTGTTVKVCADCIPSPTDQRPTALAVAGARLAVTFVGSDPQVTTLRIYSVGSSTSLLKEYSASQREFGGPSFSTDGQQLAVSDLAVTAGQVESTDSPVKLVELSGDPSGWTLTDTAASGYSPRQVAGTWYVFTDEDGDELQVWSTPDLATTPTPLATVPGNSTTIGYAVTTTAPTTQSVPSPLPAAATLAAARETTGRVQLYGYRTCTLAACDKDYVRIAGVLLKSRNGRTWSTVATTNPYPYSLTIKRTTQFIWSAAATATLAAATTGIRTVVYIPHFTEGTHTTRSVSGTFSRKKGAVVLQIFKKNKKKWKDLKVGAPMSKKGRFTLSYRFKPGKKYAVRTVADGRAGVGYSTWFRA